MHPRSPFKYDVNLTKLAILAYVGLYPYVIETAVTTVTTRDARSFWRAFQMFRFCETLGQKSVYFCPEPSLNVVL